MNAIFICLLFAIAFSLHITFNVFYMLIHLYMCLYDVWYVAYLSALHRSFGMDALVVTGTSIAFVYSSIQLGCSCASGVPTMHVFFETSGMLLLFVTMGTTASSVITMSCLFVFLLLFIE